MIYKEFWLIFCYWYRADWIRNRKPDCYPCLQALTSIASSPLRIDLRVILADSLPVLSSFLRCQDLLNKETKRKKHIQFKILFKSVLPFYLSSFFRQNSSSTTTTTSPFLSIYLYVSFYLSIYLSVYQSIYLSGRTSGPWSWPPWPSWTHSSRTTAPPSVLICWAQCWLSCPRWSTRQTSTSLRNRFYKQTKVIKSFWQNNDTMFFLVRVGWEKSSWWINYI